MSDDTSQATVGVVDFLIIVAVVVGIGALLATVLYGLR